MNTGAMIAHFPNAEVTAKLSALAKQHFGELAEMPADMHLTLVYMGEAADLGDDDPMEMENILRSLSEKMAPMQASINGISRFMDNDPNAVVVNFDAPGLVALRSFLNVQLRGQGIQPVLNHGFTPHITLAYLPGGKEMPDVRFDPIPVTLDSITLALGEERKTFPLCGSVSLSEAKRMAALKESGVYDVSVGEDDDHDLDDVAMSESVPKNAPETDFADPPSGLYVGDAKHAALAVQAVTGGLEGNKAKARNTPGVKGKIASAVRKFYRGELQKYYLSWLDTGKKPGKRPVSEARLHESYIIAPSYRVEDEARFPDVPVAPGVNIVALTAGDSDPVYVTRPLAILGAISENGLLYNDAVVNDVYTQVMNKRPVARRGHVSEADKSSLFPPDDGYWIGAVMDSSVYGKPTVFGKCYVVPGETRAMVLRRRATGTALSNSLYGDVTTAEDQNGQVTPLGVEIESIDFVPEERAALQALGGDFLVTSEMRTTEGKMAGTDEAMREAISALKPGELHEMMSEAQRHHVAESHLKEAKCSECSDTALKGMLSEGRRAKIAEMQLRESSTPEETYKMLDTATMRQMAEMYAKENNMRLIPHEAADSKDKEMAEMKRSLSEMQSRVQMSEKRVFDGDLDKAIDTYFAAYHVTTEKGQEGLGHLKGELRFRALSEMAGMKNGHVAENIDAAAKTAWEHLQPLVEMFIASAGGPPAFVSNFDNGPLAAQAQFGWDPKTGRYVEDAASAARNRASW